MSRKGLSPSGTTRWRPSSLIDRTNRSAEAWRFGLFGGSRIGPTSPLARISPKTRVRHRPDHIVVGEVRGGEAADLLQALKHQTRRITHHRPCEQRRERPVLLGELRDAERGPLPWAVTCRGVVDGIAIVIHMTRHEGRRFVEEATFVNGCDAGTNTWDMQRLDRVTV